MRYALAENPYIWARFNTGDNPTVSIYDASDDSVVINAAAMSELATTGFFKYLFDPSPVALTNYFYIASTDDEEISGAFTLGGYPDEILTDTNDLQTNQGNWLTATGFATPNEYDNILSDIHDEAFGKWDLDPTAKTLTLYESDGVTPLKVFDLTSTTADVPAFIGRTPQ